MKFIMALNALGSQPIALILVIIGCVFAIASKHFGIESTIAAGIIGLASGLLKGDQRESKQESTNGGPVTTQQITSSPVAGEIFPATPTK